MKFYIISIILNIGFLFIPLIRPASVKSDKIHEKEEVIAVKLDEPEAPQIESAVHNESEKGIEKAELKNSGSRNTEIIEKQTVIEKNNISLTRPKPEEVQKSDRERQKKSVPEPKVQTAVKKMDAQKEGTRQQPKPERQTEQPSAADTSLQTAASKTSSVLKRTDTGNAAGSKSSDTVSVNAPAGGRQGNEGKNSDPGKKAGSVTGTEGKGKSAKNSERDGGQKGGGCTVTGYRSSLKYPPAAMRLNKKGSTSITVTVKVSHGNIVNVSASGSSPFKEAALNEARSRLRVSGEGSCTITKVYTFNLN